MTREIPTQFGGQHNAMAIALQEQRDEALRLLDNTKRKLEQITAELDQLKQRIAELEGKTES